MVAFSNTPGLGLAAELVAARAALAEMTAERDGWREIAQRQPGAPVLPADLFAGPAE